jgi:hypothetical protein
MRGRSIFTFAAIGSIAAAACGVVGTEEASNPSTSSPSDSGAGVDNVVKGGPIPDDAGKDASVPPHAKLLLVNAATDLGPSSNVSGAGAQAMRLCFKQGKAEPLGVAPYPPLPREASASARRRDRRPFSTTGPTSCFRRSGSISPIASSCRT